jgi:hypothetical protein
MSEANESVVLRWARWQTRALARVWPEESRGWGEAIASEAEEIEQPLQALGWALGGATVYLRALGSHLLEWLKMPVGRRGESAPLAGGPGPKRSRLFAVVVLACAAGLLCLPEGREAIRTVKGTWEGYAQVDPSQKELERLAVQAEKENDAEALAFAALGIDDGKKAMDLADRAVKLDPRLFWIYEAKVLWRNDSRTEQDWIAKAQAADPQNAGPYLRAVSVMVDKTYSDLEKKHSPIEKEVNQILTSNSEWVTLMDKAFRAPTYKSFFDEHQELNREVWRRNPQLSLITVSDMWRHAVPNLLSLKLYAKVLVEQAEEERAAGHLERAQELLSETEGFGKRMEEDSKRGPWLTGFGLSIEHESALGWKAFYEKTGQTARAQAAAQELAEIEQRGAAMVSENQRRWAQRPRLERSGWAVQVSALLVVLTALVAALGIGLFEIWPGVARNATATRRVLSGVADFAPAVALLASAAFVLSFLPYARAMAAFREGSGGAANLLQLSTAFWSLQNVTWKMAGPDTAVLVWTVLTVVLSVIAGAILARMVYRAMRTTAPQG